MPACTSCNGQVPEPLPIHILIQMMTDFSVTRELGTFEFHDYPAVEHRGTRRWLARSQNFFVEWVEACHADAVFDFASEQETMVLVFGASAVLSAARVAAQAMPRSVCVLPPGQSSIKLSMGGTCAVLASQRDDLGARLALNQEHFLAPDPRIAASTSSFGITTRRISSSSERFSPYSWRSSVSDG